MTEWCCPKCQRELRPPKSEAVPLHTCRGCGGAWVDADGFTTAIGKRRELMKRAKQSGRTTDLNCPTCDGARLVEVPFGKCALDVCPECEGTFFDRGEWKAVAKEQKRESFAGFLVGEIIVEGVCSLITKAGQVLE